MKPVYTPGDTETLTRMAADGHPAWAIAAAVGRSTRSVKEKLCRLGISLRRARAMVQPKHNDVALMGDGTGKYSIWLRIAGPLTLEQAREYLRDRVRLAAAVRTGEVRLSSGLRALFARDKRQSALNAERRSEVARANGALGNVARWGNGKSSHPLGAAAYREQGPVLYVRQIGLLEALAPQLSGGVTDSPTFACVMAPRSPRLDVVVQ